jgi:hypothetical protein
MTSHKIKNISKLYPSYHKKGYVHPVKTNCNTSEIIK